MGSKKLYFDTNLLIKERKELATIIFKPKVKEKEYLLHIKFNPIAKTKKYRILSTVVWKLKDDIKDLNKNISTKVNKTGENIDIIYKPSDDKLFYWSKLEKAKTKDNENKEKEVFNEEKYRRK